MRQQTLSIRAASLWAVN